MEKEVFFTDINPTWLKWIAAEKFNDNDLFRIVIFYVFHCPSKDSSYMRKSLKAYGWKSPWKKPYKLNEQLKLASKNKNLIFSANTYLDMHLALEKADLKGNFPSNIERERICIYDVKKNQFESVFYHLRNAFAHCRLNMIDVKGECYFILEDGIQDKKKNKFKVSARMILSKTTLLKWIDIIENGEKEIKK